VVLRTFPWFVAGALPALLAVVVLGVAGWPLDVPYDYGGDANLNGMAVKAMLDQGWPLRNPSLGAPFAQQLLDFPFYDNLSMAVMKVLGTTSAPWPVVVNVFFLGTFPTVGLAAFAALRRLATARRHAAATSSMAAKIG
jgi:hypothetical protein